MYFIIIIIMLKFVKIKPEAYTPTKVTSNAAGFDLYSPYDVVIPANGRILISTNLLFKFFSQEEEDYYCGIIKSRSGLCLNHYITVEDGVINDDDKEMKVLLYNHGNTEYKIKRGDRIAQLVCQKIQRPKNSSSSAAAAPPVLFYSKLSQEAYVPTPNTIGFDLYSPYNVIIPRRDNILISTKLRLYIPNGCYGNIESTSKSGFGLNGITVEGGVVDRDYMGDIKVLLYNHNNGNDYTVKKGDVIAQIICQKICYPTLVEKKKGENFNENGSSRGIAGFGSSGK